MTSNDSDQPDHSDPVVHPSPTTPNPPDPDAAHGRGAVDTVETKWRRLPLVWQARRTRHGMTGPAFPGIRRFRIHRARGSGSGSGSTVIGETGTAEEAVALVVAHLPDDLGPAVTGTADDLGR